MLGFELLRRLYPSADEINLRRFSEQSGSLLPEFGISEQRNRLHFFLAQMGHESGGLRIRSEKMSYSATRMMQVWPSRFPTLASTEGFVGNPEALANKVYGGRMGNDKPGDGFRFLGRGYIQITGREGYREVGARAGLDLEKNPDLALEPEQALRVACAFWSWKRLNPLCDQGDFVAVTKRINGGTVGLQDRFHWLERVQDLVAWPGAAAPAVALREIALSTARLKAIQIKLADLGLYQGSIDGIFGKNSRAALKIFQAEAGLPKNGLLDQKTIDALGA